MLFDSRDDFRPIERRSSPVMREWLDGLRRQPAQILRIVQRSFDRGECAARPRQFDACLHGVITHKLHDLTGEIFAGVRAISHSESKHRITQAHDAQSDAARAMRGFRKLRHSRHVLVRINYIVEKMS